MKSLIGLIVIIVALVALAGAAVVNNGDEAEASEKPWLQEEPVVAAVEPVFEENCCGCDDLEQNGPVDCTEEVNATDTAEFEMGQVRMAQEVELLWDMWFDDEGAKISDPRRRLFPEYAEYVADAVLMYRSKPTDIGGMLPGHKNDHLYVAYTIARESSVTYDVIGTSHNEVGLMQLHGKSLAGYAPEKVRRNARLGILLGVRWLASQIPKCEQNGAGGVYGDEFAWEDADWIGPLSLYAGGPKARRKDGGCAQYSKMRERVDIVRMFRTRIDHKMEHWED